MKGTKEIRGDMKKFPTKPTNQIESDDNQSLEHQFQTMSIGEPGKKLKIGAIPHQARHLNHIRVS
jgi:hypothetical protein